MQKMQVGLKRSRVARMNDPSIEHKEIRENLVNTKNTCYNQCWVGICIFIYKLGKGK
jgi:hypothetical protein